MPFALSLRRSLKTRIIVAVLIILVVNTAALSLLISHRLKNNMLHVMGQQQFLVTSLLADHIENQLKYRISALEHYASIRIEPWMLDYQSALQERFERSPAILQLFNGGIFLLI